MQTLLVNSQMFSKFTLLFGLSSWESDHAVKIVASSSVRLQGEKMCDDNEILTRRLPLLTIDYFHASLI